jgi:hypothetical protein
MNLALMQQSVKTVLISNESYTMKREQKDKKIYNCHSLMELSPS